MMDEPLDDELQPLSEDFLFNPVTLQQNVTFPSLNRQLQPPPVQHIQHPHILPKQPLQIQRETPPEASSNNSSPIDTVSPESESKPRPAKRRNKPCNQCRVRKVKCIRLPNEEQCKECQKKDQNCEFDKTSYAKVIENYNATCDNCCISRTKCIRLPNSKACLECSLKGLKMTCKFSKGRPQVKLINNNEPVTDYNNYIEYHGLLTNSLHLQSLNNCIPINPSSTGLIDPSILKSDRSDFEDLSNAFHDEIVFKTFKDSEELINLSIQQCDEIERIIQPYGLNLINLYFKKIQPFYPIINQQVFLEKYSRTHKEINPLLLVMVYLHALRFKHLDIGIKIDNSQVSKLENLMELYYLESLNYKNTKFSNIQSFQLLLQYENFTKSKKLMHELVFVSEELGLNIKNLHLANWEKEVRLKLSWNLKVWDKLTAVLEFKSSRINDANWNLEPLSHIERESSFFSSFIKLIDPLNKILLSLQNMRSYEEDTFAIISIKYDQCLKSLNVWYLSIERNFTEQPNDFISLKFLHYLLVFSLDRRIIRSHQDLQDLLSLRSNLSDPDTLKYNDSLLPKVKQHLSDFKTLFINEINQNILSNTFWINKRTVITGTIINYFITAHLLGDKDSISQFYDVIQGFRMDYSVLLVIKHVEKYYME